MRGEQGLGLLHIRDGGRKGVVTDRKEYTKVMTDRVSDLQGFRLFVDSDLQLDSML